MSGSPSDAPTRRQFVRASFAGLAALMSAAAAEHASGVPGVFAAADVCGPDPFSGGEWLGAVPFTDSGDVQFGTLVGKGLDARLLLDLSTLDRDTLVTPSDKYYVRTAYPDGIDASAPWKIPIGGLVRQTIDVALPDLLPAAAPRGLYVMECAGNSLPGQFGLLSAAQWDGVPLVDVLARVERRPSGTRILVSGFDEHVNPSYTSSPGASWIFSMDDLRSTGAFLATKMNGQPLPKDHGYPVRLYVPRWYGCACIKWVNEIRVVGEDEPSTAQMQEFGPRTFQNGRPPLAREYKPIAMDQAAMPVRIEKWRVEGRVLYKVIGVMWGGARPIDRLAIRYHPREPFVPVAVCPAPATTDTWALWSTAWRPAHTGPYRLVLRVIDSDVPSERLDAYYYTREVRIEEV